MADTVKSSETLNLEAEFTDGDTRSITLDNPRASLTAADIDNVPRLNRCLIGDKTGSQFLRWKTAKRVHKDITDIDLSNGG